MKRHALFIGVNDYADPSIQNLAFPSEDAAELASVFRRLLKFDRVEKLVNPGHSPEVVDAVKDMTRGLGPGDLFLFFFAGMATRGSAVPLTAAGTILATATATSASASVAPHCPSGCFVVRFAQQI